MAENVQPSQASAGDHEEESDGEDLLLAEVIASQKELEDTANAVLGDSDDANCSYAMVS